MARRVLVPVDFSEFSARAVDMAVLETTDSGSIVLLHVYEPPHLGRPDFTTWVKAEGEMMPLAVLVKAEAREKLDSLIETYSSRTKATITAMVAEGRAAATIVETARNESCDLIVIGTHGRSGFKRLVLGEVSEGVVRAAGCPVLTVPPSEASQD